MRAFITSLLIFCVTLFQSQAWWETGHMLVAQIAKQELLANYPSVYSRAENITLFIKGLTKNLSDSFIEAAVWMDDIKGDPFDTFYTWHFINRPYNPLGLDVGTIDPVNSEYAVSEAIKVLNNSKTRGETTLTKSIFLRALLHVVGDMHQPLHDASLFNLTYPKGDMGGNLEKVFVMGENKTMPLHSFWDAVAFRVPNDMPRPLAPVNVTQLEQIAKNLTTEFPRSALQDRLSKTNVTQWSIDCYLDAVERAYKPLRTDFVLDESYQQQAYDTMRRNIALGGYRLADILYSVLRLEAQSPVAQKVAAFKKILH